MHDQLDDHDALFCEFALRARLLTATAVEEASRSFREGGRQGSISKIFIRDYGLDPKAADHLDGLVETHLETIGGNQSLETLLAEGPPGIAGSPTPGEDQFRTLEGESENRSDECPAVSAGEPDPFETRMHEAPERARGDAETRGGPENQDALATRPPSIDPDATLSSPPLAADDQLATQPASLGNPFATRDSLETRAAEGGPVAAAGPAGFSGMRFRVIRQHAEGGLGKVLLASDCDFQREVAVKEIKERFADNPGSRERFLFEAMVTGRLEHPGVVPVYALGQYADGRPYYAMRFIGGSSLEAELKKLHQLEGDGFRRGLRELLNRFVSVCNTIEYAHSRRVVHRDLKPANIMIGEYGETLVVDWGLAKSLNEPDASQPADSSSLVDAPRAADSPPTAGDSEGPEKTRVGEIVGTPQFMPPEQAAGQGQLIGPASDVYSLGATLYQLVTGATPIVHERGSTIDALLEKVRSGAVRPAGEARPGTPRPLAAILEKAMQREPSQRYASARELARDIENFLADEKVSVMPENPLQRAGRWLRKHRSWTAAIGVSLVLIAVVASFATVITQGALHETQVQRNVAQRQREVAEFRLEFDNTIGREEQRLATLSLDAPLRDVVIPVSLVESLVTKVGQIEALSEEPDVRRERLLSVWTESLVKLSEHRMTTDAAQYFRSQIDRLEKSFLWPGDAHQRAVSRVNQLYDSRLADWYALSTAPLEQREFEESKDAQGWIRMGGDPVVFLGDCLPGNLEATVEFGEQWRRARALGLLLNDDQEHRYRFVVADKDYSPLFGADSVDLSLGEANDQGSLRLFVCRDDEILRQVPLKVESVNLTLRAVRESVTRLVAQVGAAEAEFQDVFPLSPLKAGRGGVICPTGQTLVSFSLRHQRHLSTVKAPEIERGDQLFAQGDYAEARREYGLVKDSAEAAYKTALCHLYNNDKPQYMAGLRDVLKSHPPADRKAAESEPWFLFAGVHLLTEAISSTADEVHNVSETLDRIKLFYSLEDVARLVPTALQKQLLDGLAKPGQRFRIAFQSKGDVEDLQNALKIHSVLNGDDLSRRQAKWRLADALRTQRDRTPQQRQDAARKVLRELLSELDRSANVDEMERATLLSDLVWIEIVDQKFPEAMGLIAPYLNDDFSKMRTEHWPLLIDRARLQHAVGDLAGARSDLEAFVNHVDPRGSGEVNPPPGVHYSHFSEACALLGMLYENVENPPREPHTVWMRGRRRFWGRGYPTVSQMRRASGAEMVLESHWAEPVLASWTRGKNDGGYLPIEMRKEIDLTMAGSAITDGMVRNIVKNTGLLRDDWIQVVMETANDGPRGRRVAQDGLLRRRPLLEFHEIGALMLFYQAVLQVTYEGDETLRKYPEAEQLVYDQCYAIIRSFQDRDEATNKGIDQKDMEVVLRVWSGITISNEEFGKLATRLDNPTLSSGLALVFGIMHVKYHNAEFGRKFLQDQILERTGEGLPPVYQAMAEEAIQRAEREARDGT